MRDSKDRAIALASVVCLIVCSSPAYCQSIIIERDVPMAARDGTILRSDVYHLPGNGRYPVLLQRDPYGKALPGSGTWHDASPERLAQNGYVVVIQDSRGLFASAGEFVPFRDDASDGYDAVEWAARLPNSNGSVGLYGSSYLGATQLLAAMARPPHLKSIFPMMTASDYYDGWIYSGGAFSLWFASTWAIKSFAGGKVNDWQRWVRVLPLSDIPRVTLGSDAHRMAYFNDWLEHERSDAYWARWSIQQNFTKLDYPAFHIAGWHDIFLKGTLNNYLGLSKAHPNRPQFLLVGPWAHYPMSATDHKYGELDFGPTASLDIDAILLQWADYSLKADKQALRAQPKVRLFVMGRNEWRDEAEWPLKRAQRLSFYLHSNGNARSVSGIGKLSQTPPTAEPIDSYQYDPSNPVPTIGGPLCCDDSESTPGPHDQTAVETRQDVLVYSTDTLSKAVEVTGPVSATLYVASDAPDTDFTAKLVDVYPDGRAYNVTEGILRMRRRDGDTLTAPRMVHGKVYRVTIDLIATSNEFQVGHRIRLEISSSNFPRFDRNLNSGEPLISGQRPRTATNTIFHDSSYPSTLELPVIPQQQ
jgi:uncharacterized protein